MWRRLALATVLAGVGLAAQCLAAGAPAHATVQEDGICWDPDVEFPIACDDGEE